MSYEKEIDHFETENREVFGLKDSEARKQLGRMMPDWEMVYETVLDEDVAQLEYTDLDCSNVRVVIFGRWNNEDNTAADAIAKANVLLNNPGSGYHYSGDIGYVRAANCFHTLIDIDVINKMYPRVRVSTLTMSGTSYNRVSESAATGTDWKNGKKAKLNKILIVPATSGMLLKAGAVISVMKRV